MHIGIVGAGHAGVAAAVAAREAGPEVTLFSAEDVVPYYRPRLTALAFGQAEFAAIRLHPPEWYGQAGIRLMLGRPVEAMDPAAGKVTSAGETLRFDGLVLACGAWPILPPFAAGAAGNVLPLWHAGHAGAIRRQVRTGGRLVVLGGGILGIEAALRGIEAGMKVEIAELMDRLMPAQFGDRASRVLLRRLTEQGIVVHLGHAVTAAGESGNGIRLTFDDGRVVEADLCLTTIGARPAKSLAATAGLTTGRGVVVDEHLAASRARCFAAGDMIQFEGVTRCSMQEAVNQGRIAGANCAASLVGGALRAYAPETQPLTFRSRDFELYSIGEPGGIGFEEHLLEGTTERMIRSLVVKDGIPMGVQMIGTREGFDEYVRTVKVAAKRRADSPAS